MVSTIGIESKNLFCPEGAEHTPSLQDESFFHICPVVETTGCITQSLQDSSSGYNIQDINILYLKLTALAWQRLPYFSAVTEGLQIMSGTRHPSNRTGIRYSSDVST